MAIDGFHVFDAIVCPNKTDEVLVVDPNGMLAFAFTLERFQPVARLNAEVV
jgi:hypothetical protein